MGTFAESAIINTIYHLPTKKNKLPISISFAGKKQKFAISALCLQKTNVSCSFPLVPFSVCGNMKK
jgi:hypothetical protein